MATKITGEKSLKNRVEELIELQNMIDELNSRVDEIKDAIKEYMGEAELITAGDYTVRYTKVSSERMDTKLLKVDHPKLYEKYLYTSTYRRFSIT